jgi:hypothetical protein
MGIANVNIHLLNFGFGLFPLICLFLEWQYGFSLSRAHEHVLHACHCGDVKTVAALDLEKMQLMP